MQHFLTGLFVRRRHSFSSTVKEDGFSLSLSFVLTILVWAVSGWFSVKLFYELTFPDDRIVSKPAEFEHDTAFVKPDLKSFQSLFSVKADPMARSDVATVSSPPLPLSEGWRLLGVVTDRRQEKNDVNQIKSGVALFALPGQGSKHYRVGQEIASGWFLVSVTTKSADIGRVDSSGHLVGDSVRLDVPMLVVPDGAMHVSN